MVLPKMSEEIECPRCGALLGRKNYEDEKLVMESEKATLTEVEAEKRWERDHQQEESVEPEHAEQETARQRCERCGAMVITADHRFCASCGAPLAVEPAAVISEEKTCAPQVMPTIPKELTRGPKCMVCELPLKRKDSKLYCPYCGNAAHRDHFLEWLRVKKVCPICGERVQESELKITIRETGRQH
jgi:predicted RNA-binding Zn-ribbon protein involved in translation (DUF1610 family)